MVGACALRASRAGGDAILACGIGKTVRLLIGVCARAPVTVPNAARIAVLAVVRSSLRRFIAYLPLSGDASFRPLLARGLKLLDHFGRIFFADGGARVFFGATRKPLIVVCNSHHYRFGLDLFRFIRQCADYFSAHAPITSVVPRWIGHAKMQTVGNKHKA
jgi:hypothetical protein